MTKTAIPIVGVFQNTDTEIRAVFYLEDMLQAHVVTGNGSQQVPAELVVLFPRASVCVRNVPEGDLLLILERLERNDPNAFAGIGPENLNHRIVLHYIIAKVFHNWRRSDPDEASAINLSSEKHRQAAALGWGLPLYRSAIRQP